MNGKEQVEVKPANSLVELIGVKLERVHCVSSVAPNMYAGVKSIVLCFSNGKSIHMDAELCTREDGSFPVIKLEDGDWEMLKAAPDEDYPPMPEVKSPKEDGDDQD